MPLQYSGLRSLLVVHKLKHVQPGRCLAPAYGVKAGRPSLAERRIPIQVPIFNSFASSAREGVVIYETRTRSMFPSRKIAQIIFISRTITRPHGIHVFALGCKPTVRHQPECVSAETRPPVYSCAAKARPTSDTAPLATSGGTKNNTFPSRRPDPNVADCSRRSHNKLTRTS